ncbi:MAG: TAXI family TRAP transporter solute-binding subunit [Betaproteobacteria bacterium]
MPRIIRDTLVSVRELMLSFGPFILLGIALLVGAYFLLDPQPPKRVVLLTGPERSAYEEFGQRYVAELKRHGIAVELRPTNGASENLRLLRNPKERADLAFIQGGAGERINLAQQRKKDIENALELESLGSLFYEPVWLFYREASIKKISRDGLLPSIPALRGLRVNVGGRGSGAPGVTSRILTANQVEREELKRTTLPDSEAVVKLLEGELDAMVMVTAPESLYVQMLLRTPGIRLYEFVHAEAYARRHAYISPVVLPRGVAHLSLDVPPRDLQLIAPTTSLVAREGTHPALVQLFVQAAARIHSAPGWIARAGTFPTGAKSEFPLADEAERFYRAGAPLLQRYMPFWLANLVDRMWVALFSIIAALIPLSRLLPPLYRFRVRSRVFRWYRNLRSIEDRLDDGDASPQELLAELDKIETRTARIQVPLAYADELYSLRSHIDLVRARLQHALQTSLRSAT